MILPGHEPASDEWRDQLVLLPQGGGPELPRREFLGLTGRLVIAATGLSFVASTRPAVGARQAPGNGCGPGWPQVINTCDPTSGPNTCSTLNPHSCDGQGAKNVCVGARWMNTCQGTGANTCKNGAQNICQQGAAETNRCIGAVQPAANRCQGSAADAPANECHDVVGANFCDPYESGNKCDPPESANWCEQTPQGSAHGEDQPTG